MAFTWRTKTEKPRHDNEADMSMEEILTSIRRYVTNDQSVSPQDRPVQEGNPEKKSLLKDTPEDVIELKHPIEDDYQKKDQSLSKPSSAKGVSYTQDAKSAFQEQPQPSSQLESNFSSNPATTEPAAYHPPHVRDPISVSLASQHTVSTSAQAFSKLTAVAQQQQVRGEMLSSVTLDQLVMDVTKPLIKEWIDKNLATLVETMVAKEIERITRGGRF